MKFSLIFLFIAVLVGGIFGGSFCTLLNRGWCGDIAPIGSILQVAIISLIAAVVGLAIGQILGRKNGENTIRIITVLVWFFGMIFTIGHRAYSEALREQLKVAALQENLARMKLLLMIGADPNLKGMLDTPFDEAVIQGKMASVKFLLEHGAKFNRSSTIYNSARAAFAQKNTELLNLYLDHGGTCDTFAPFASNQPASPTLLLSNQAHPENFAITPLHLAAAKKDLAKVEALLRAGSPVDAKTCYDVTPLDIAVDANDAEIAKLLIDHGAQVKSKHLDTAYTRNAVALIKLLEAKKPITSEPELRSRLEAALSSKSSPDLLEPLILGQNGVRADFCKQDYLGLPQKVLGLAIHEDKLNWARAVVEQFAHCKNPDPRLVYQSIVMPILWAIGEKKWKIAIILLDRRIPFDASDLKRVADEFKSGMHGPDSDQVYKRLKDLTGE